MFDVPPQVLFGQLLIGLINGSFYALLSLGLAVIFGMLNIINFAHGAQYMMGAFVAFLLLQLGGVNYWFALLVAPIVVGIIGVVIERLFLQRLYKLDHLYGLLLTFGLVFVVSGVAFKLGVVPYHMWIPDVYDGAPTAITLLIGTAPEFAGFALTLRLLSGALQGMAIDWQGMLIVLSVLSMVLGNVVAIAQSSIKRMLAYSTISHMGFMLMGFLAADLNGYSAAMFYTVTYVLTSLVSFGLIMVLSRAGFEADQIDDFKGLNQRSPWWAFIMLLVMFSLAGLPPMVGFYAKFTVIEAAINAGFVWLAVLGVVTSLIGAFYYLRIVRLMYFDDPVDRSPLETRADTRTLLSANGLLLLLLGILPQPLMGICVIALTQSNFL